MLTSILIIRRQVYDLSLVTHVILAVIFVVGCWYHIQFEYGFTFGYETWLYTAIAVWFFDRLIRLLRLLKAGLHYAKIVRIDIPGLRWAIMPCHRVHVHFPPIHPWRACENHPFSIIPTSILSPQQQHAQEQNSDAEGRLDEKARKAIHITSDEDSQNRLSTNGFYINTGVTIFVRKGQDMTSYLKPCERLLTLVDGPYRCSANQGVLRSDHLLLIGGGIRITGLLSFLNPRQRIVKLYYSLKRELLMDARMRFESFTRMLSQNPIPSRYAMTDEIARNQLRTVHRWWRNFKR
ncbi:ferric-chelate reductase (Fre2), putative [Talaromyces stipitatus ATCC 10500]|uniref:Ferric-chelate reductase (Fre2), putative n=1 Tax=Talaromyces stipitatus (strain ATCC 10500 / CBS 375.48 / QM 6759 / NRRL 1006) TaxID=441959 RepID=B8MDY9_TALSN|nr:ferric-chelate reductase (Fre2), putative [Talaromyces stipitatus ATCC 10500]EED16066.1 ferric-chelate reductase (Fre2), putative [Talaromyces stipitatus ATCC 10500]